MRMETLLLLLFCHIFQCGRFYSQPMGGTHEYPTSQTAFLSSTVCLLISYF